MFSMLLAFLVVLARAQSSDDCPFRDFLGRPECLDCDDNCLYQRRTCVEDGDYCDEDSYDLFQNGGTSNYPCFSPGPELSRSSCYICDTGMITDDATSSVNRLCINNICTETGQNLGDSCCSDWDNMKSQTPRDTDTCAVSVQGLFCKPQFRCDWNSTTGIGVCEEFSTIGSRYLLGLGEACTLWDPDVLRESSEDLTYCDIDNGLDCDVGQVGGNITEFYGRSGTCKGFEEGGEFYDSGVCDNSNQCPWGQKCTGVMLITLPF